MYTLLLRLFGDDTAQANCGDDTGLCHTGLPKVDLTNMQVHQILTIVFGSFAALSVLMIVIAAFRFVIAQGEPEQIAKARKTIIYAVVGLIVSLSAEAFVAFALGKLI